MVEKALAWWLQHGSLTGLQATRKTNLLTWRQYVGPRIWLARVPSNTGNYGCVLTRVATNREAGITREFPMAFAVTQVDIYGRHDNAASKVAELADALRLSVHHYNGTWDTVSVGSVEIIRESHLPEPPLEGATYWQHRWSMDLRIEFAQTVVNQGA